MAEIVLTTLNAKYIHAAFGLRCLLANLGEMRPRAALLEFDINQRVLDIAERILSEDPRLVGLGVYIWNAAPAADLVATLKRIRPELTIVLGGPEVSYETENQAIVTAADYTISGEGDLAFAALCRQILAGAPPRERLIVAPAPEFSQLALPYAHYTDQDLAHRVVYVEASRGCPFTCEFCLSSLDIPVRQAPLELLLAELQKLLDRGLKRFKFVDRTFNLNAGVSRAILEFFLERHRPDRFYHFEMIPDRLPESLRETIARFPPGALQFEVGIQTFNPEAAALISRRQNYERVADNFAFLRNRTGVHLHADLIVGLPGEEVESFGAGFDRLLAMGPQEIQVGMLKRLRGTPIARHDREWQMAYSPHPPYEILQNRLISFREMQRLRRFARFWDLVGNSGNFNATLPLVWSGHGPDERAAGSPFRSLLRLADWLYGRTGRTDSIALIRLMQLVFEYLTTETGQEPPRVAQALWSDYRRGGRTDKPAFLKAFLAAEEPSLPPVGERRALPKRQARHLG